ncbi:hypothetical protein [Salinibius halmophilus]|uniref:hypothetical protein n=1 Tax=Salinibius halmophilus TaxID=1853216 RepID=UPI000E66793E|nr:hypothetical protein [Salinibius halmophilus]
MSENFIPTTYDAWKHCITKECEIELTLPYVEARLEALQNDHDEHTRQFVQLYGEGYHQTVIAWFKQARRELSN